LQYVKESAFDVVNTN